MKVKVRDLKPNPFRKIKSYPINEEKVSALKKSIKETGFWDNILARKKDSNIEIAYGHHRLMAIKKVLGGNAVVDIPIKKLDDATMIRIMANENDQDYDTSPAVINETVKVTKEFLEKTRKSGAPVGAREIAEFLGGNWNATKVQDSLKSLEMLKGKSLDEDAFNMMPTQRSVRNLSRAIEKAEKNSGRKVPKSVQRSVAKEASKGQISEVGIKERVEQSVFYGKKIKKLQRPELNALLSSDILRSVRWLTERFASVNKHKKYIDDEVHAKLLPQVKKLIKELESFKGKGV